VFPPTKEDLTQSGEYSDIEESPSQGDKLPTSNQTHPRASSDTRFYDIKNEANGDAEHESGENVKLESNDAINYKVNGDIDATTNEQIHPTKNAQPPLVTYESDQDDDESKVKSDSEHASPVLLTSTSKKRKAEEMTNGHSYPFDGSPGLPNLKTCQLTELANTVQDTKPQHRSSTLQVRPFTYPSPHISRALGLSRPHKRSRT
jgi:hypothetical protein